MNQFASKVATTESSNRASKASAKGKAELIRKPLSALVAAGLIFLMVFGHPQWFGTWPMEILRLFGFLCVFAGVLGRILCTLYIGGRKNRELYQSGIYSFCRNPLYFFSFVGLTGICLLTQSLALTLLACSLFLILYNRVIVSEEHKLLRMFPIEFPIYQKNVPRFWPCGRPQLPSQVLSVDTGIFIRSLTEVLWFLASIIFVEFTIHARAIGLIPSLFSWF
jgi:protein-S-isoprenylcysteine O-methyltransferase Ste14